MESAVPVNAKVSKDSIKIDMEIKFPPKDTTKKKAKPKAVGTLLSAIFAKSPQRCPEPVYFQSIDCVGFPRFLSSEECHDLINAADDQGFSTQDRHPHMKLSWTDFVDPFLAQAIWSVCGLQEFMKSISVDGLVPCGINEVLRVQKYTQGGHFGRHTDQHVKRADGKISKYSLRIFLNGRETYNGEDRAPFEGGFSAFHLPFRQEPVVFEPEPGLALIYPQGELCTVQEETKVTDGVKYVLRADVLFESASRGNAN